MKVLVFAVALLGAFVAGPVAAQTALTGGTVHVGNGDVIEEGVVVFGADGELLAVGGADTATPAGATLVDVSGSVVTPGFIDVETRLGLVEISAVDRTRDADAGAVDPGPGGADPIRAAFRAVDAFNPRSAVIAVQRSGGITSVVTTPAGGLISGQAAFVDLAGARTFATVVEPFAALRINVGGQGQGSRGTALLRLREVFDDALFYAANRTRFDENRARSLAASRLDLDALVLTVQAQKPVTFEVDRAADIEAVLRLSSELGLRPVIVGGAEAWRVADALAAANVPVIVDALINLPYNFDMLGSRLDNAALLADAGVPVVLSAFDTHNARSLRFHAGNAVRAGMDHGAALQAVTRNAAAAVGMEATHGTLEAGKVANVVVWSGDPFQPRTRVEQLFIGGELIDRDNRQRELFEKYRELSRRAEPAATEAVTTKGGRDVEPND